MPYAFPRIAPLAALVALQLIAFAPPASALAFDDIARIYLERSPRHLARLADIAVADARVATAGQKPNPVASVSTETLRGGGRETETTLVLGNELDVRGVRRFRIEFARLRRDALALQVEQEAWLDIVAARRLFLTGAALAEDARVLAKAAASAGEFLATLRARQKGGDATELDVLKAATEHRALTRLRDAAERESGLVARKLALDLGFATESVRLEGGLPPAPELPSSAELAASGREHLVELRAAGVRIESILAAVEEARRTAAGPVEVEAGYKGRTGGFKGFALSLSIPMPWEHRNEGPVREALAEAEGERIRRDAALASYEARLALARETGAHHAATAADLAREAARLAEVTRIVRETYREGDAAILDAVDALRAETAVRLERNRELLAARSAVCDLEALTGAPLLKGGAK